MIIFFFLLCHSTLALIYNDVCTNKCDLPGLICLNNRCVCDAKNRLFWTGARCITCENSWTMTETACLILFQAQMTWEMAKLSCRDVQAELISFRNQNLIQLIDTVSNKLSSTGIIDKFSAWTSAYLLDYSGLYQWLDPTVASFNSGSGWWCKSTTPNLGYIYLYNEPTKQRSVTNEIEACVVYRRSLTTPGVICLDDQFCSKLFPVVCEKSESTAIRYIGPAPKPINVFNVTTSVRSSLIYTIPNNAKGPIIHTIPSNAGAIIINTGGQLLPNSDVSKSKSIVPKVIGLFLCLLILLLLLGGIYFFLKHRSKDENRGFSMNNIIDNKTTNGVSKKTIKMTNDPIIKEESIGSYEDKSEISSVGETEPVPLTSMTPIDLPKSSKNKRGGYSKQHFDEFE